MVFRKRLFLLATLPTPVVNLYIEDYKQRKQLDLLVHLQTSCGNEMTSSLLRRGTTISK